MLAGKAQSAFFAQRWLWHDPWYFTQQRHYLMVREAIIQRVEGKTERTIIYETFTCATAYYGSKRFS
jgi:hypothetical protein